MKPLLVFLRLLKFPEIYSRLGVLMGVFAVRSRGGTPK
nr:MAG TPA: hypothetical protein [Caudoviricetes sp.]